jgi:hypothetical protein
MNKQPETVLRKPTGVTDGRTEGLGHWTTPFIKAKGQSKAFADIQFTIDNLRLTIERH